MPRQSATPVEALQLELTARVNYNAGMATRPPGYRKDGRVDLRRLPRIIERPLGRHGAYGLAGQLLHGSAGGDVADADWNPATDPPTLWLDSTLRGREELETAIHEALHLSCPWMFEAVVTAVGRYVARVIWHMGWRR